MADPLWAISSTYDCLNVDVNDILLPTSGNHPNYPGQGGRIYDGPEVRELAYQGDQGDGSGIVITGGKAGLDCSKRGWFKEGANGWDLGGYYAASQCLEFFVTIQSLAPTGDRFLLDTGYDNIDTGGASTGFTFYVEGTTGQLVYANNMGGTKQYSGLYFAAGTKTHFFYQLNDNSLYTTFGVGGDSKSVNGTPWLPPVGMMIGHCGRINTIGHESHGLDCTILGLRFTKGQRYPNVTSTYTAPTSFDTGVPSQVTTGYDGADYSDVCAIPNVDDTIAPAPVIVTRSVTDQGAGYTYEWFDFWRGSFPVGNDTRTLAIDVSQLAWYQTSYIYCLITETSSGVVTATPMWSYDAVAAAETGAAVAITGPGGDWMTELPNWPGGAPVGTATLVGYSWVAPSPVDSRDHLGLVTAGFNGTPWPLTATLYGWGGTYPGTDNWSSWHYDNVDAMSLGAAVYGDETWAILALEETDLDVPIKIVPWFFKEFLEGSDLYFAPFPIANAFYPDSSDFGFWREHVNTEEEGDTF